MNPTCLPGIVASMLFIAATARPSRAQLAQLSAGAPLAASANVEPGATVASNATVAISLNRPLSPDEGELALIVGGLDVTAVAERSARGVVYRPGAIALPVGHTELALFRRRAGVWSEIRRFSLTVVQAAGVGASFDKNATLGNTGQVAEGHSQGSASPTRRTFQDFVLNAGLRSTIEKDGLSIVTQSNYVGVTQRQQALRFGTLANRAPMLDLSDYRVTLQRSGSALAVGHVNFGTSRHLANGFAARGGTFTVTKGATTLSLGALNGSSQLGWDNIVGLERADNRVFGAALAREMFAAHPGSLRLEVTVLDGSKAPAPSFTRAAVVDAERSTGGTMQLSAALPNQRARVTAGYTRSRFENPANDPQLAADLLGRNRPRAETRGARFVEASMAALQNLAVPIAGASSLTFGFREERVDPLFASVAAQAAADRQQDNVDAIFSLGAVTAQGSQSWGRDNLGNVASVLTTNNVASTGTIALPLARIARIGARANWLPVVTVALNRTHQMAAGMPVNGAFRAQDLPNQVSASGDVAAQWQLGRWRASLRLNRAGQDNRQDERQNADFASGVNALSVGHTLGSSGDVSIDAGTEFQLSKERNERTRVQRVSVNGALPLPSAFRATLSLSAVDTRLPTGASSLTSDERLELSRPLPLWPGANGANRGQVFVRFARSSSLLPDPALAPLAPAARIGNRQWTLATGLSLRLL